VALGVLALLPAAVLANPVTVVADRNDSAETALDQVNRLEALLEAQQAKIESLKDRLETLEADSVEAARTEAVREVVRDLMADAGFRESLYPDIQQVGYDNGFYIKSSDEAFALKLNGFMRIRWTGQNRQTDNPRVPGRQKQDDINGFEIEDLYLFFRGHIHDPKLTYNIAVLGDTDQNHSWTTYYAFVNYQFAPELNFIAGLLELPHGRQQLVDRSFQQFVDRSLANEFFNLDRSIGFGFHGTLAKKLSYMVAAANGAGNPNDSPSQEELDTNFAIGGRLVAHLLGEGPIQTESDLAYTKDPRLEVGLSIAYEDDNGDAYPPAPYSIPDRVRRGRGIGGSAFADISGVDIYQIAADTAFRYRGFSATAEYFVRTINGEDEFSAWELQTGRDDATHQQGGYVQAGYFIIPKKVEVAGRLGGVWDNNGDDVWEYTLGVNYFPWSSYNVVLQADFTRIAEAPTSSSEANWSVNDEITMVRVQMQVRF